MRLFAEMLPRHNTDLGDGTDVVDWQAFCEVLRQHWPRVVTKHVGLLANEVFAPLDDHDALTVYKGVVSGALLHDSGLTWLQLSERRKRRTEKHS